MGNPEASRKGDGLRLADASPVGEPEEPYAERAGALRTHRARIDRRDRDGVQVRVQRPLSVRGGPADLACREIHRGNARVPRANDRHLPACVRDPLGNARRERNDEPDASAAGLMGG